MADDIEFKLIEELPATSAALAEIATERYRQIEELGHTAEWDDHAYNGATQYDLAKAAGCYALAQSNGDWALPNLPGFWPWASVHWKPKSHRENVVRAAALLVAELERIDREEGAAHEPDSIPDVVPGIGGGEG